MPPVGGVRTGVSNLVAALTQPFKQRRGAPSYSPQGQLANGTANITQFADTFQPSGGLFAPGYPLVPVEREQLRRFDFPVGYNYIYTPRSYERYTFDDLRTLAENSTLVRLCIETRKDQIESLGWTINSIDNEAISADAERRAATLTDFFREPDGRSAFGTWLREGLEDLLVIDAPTLEVRRNRGGDVIGLEWINGATIKVLLDDTGRPPLPPAPAYEQVIHGRPWVLTEDGNKQNTEERGKPVFPDQVIYMPRNPRIHKAYGFSPVEQVLLTANVAFRREIQQLQYFTDGNVPRGIIRGAESWTPDQLREYQEWFDSLLEGNTGNKQKVLWVPAGSSYQAFLDSAEFVKGKFDEWMARVVCFAFSLPPTAFVERINRATAQTAQEAALQEGLGPLMAWVKRLIDTVIQKRMGHKDLEFSWELPPELDPQTQADILKIYCGGMPLLSTNEGRDAIGKDPVAGGDELMVMTAQGPITIAQALEAAAQAQESANAAPEPNPAPPSDGSQGAPQETQDTTKAVTGTLSPAAAGYVPRPIAGQRCADCTMFVLPAACTLVRGPISQNGHCRYFSPKREGPNAIA